MRSLKNSRDCKKMKISESRIQELEAMGSWDLSIEEFDAIDERHEFSERYKRKKRRLLAGLQQIEELHREDRIENIPSAGKIKSRAKRAVAAAAAAVLLIPTTVFAATKFYELRVNQKKHEAQIEIELKNDTAEELTAEETYILKEDGVTDITYRSPLKVTLAYVPKECTRYSDYKFDDSEQTGAYGISMWMLLGDASTKCEDKVKYSIGSEKREINGQEYVVVTRDETFDYNKKVFVPLEEWNAIFMMDVGKGISVEELDKIVAGIQVEETSDMAEAVPSDDIEGSYLLNDETDEEEETAWDGILGDIPIYHIGDTVKQNPLDITVDQIQVLDSIKELDRANFYTEMLKSYVRKDGTLAEYNRARISYGDGTNSVNHFVEKMKMRQKFVYITLKLKTGKASVSQYYINSFRSVFLKQDKKGNYLLDKNADALYNLDDGQTANFDELMYFDNSLVDNKDKNFFNMGDIPGHTEKTVHIGFFVDEDLLDEMYIQIPYSRYGDVSKDQTQSFYIKIQK